MSGSGDSISREAAREAVWQILNGMGYSEKHNDRLVEEVDAILGDIPAADVRPVVTCSDCKWWTKQESSLQGRCELLQMYPTGAWFCANGKREES